MLPAKEAPTNEMQQFLQSAVHDLRAAQRRTGIASELLLQCTDQPELAAQIQDGLSKTEDLLTGISRYANVLTHSGDSVSVFPFRSALRFALANLDREIRQTGAVISAGELPEISGNRDRLAELLQHLIHNSLKFKGSAPPVVEISAASVPEGWRFSVSDNGEGIPAKYHDRLFIPFRRLQGTEVPGAGLGLAISRKIVEAHGGRIWIEDRAGPGVTICFTLPAGNGD
jgi:light-regulated signal transduction histidine kinase (bacteriophytochrome)